MAAVRRVKNEARLRRCRQGKCFVHHFHYSFSLISSLTRFSGSSRLYDFNDMRHSITRPFRILCSLFVNASTHVSRSPFSLFVFSDFLSDAFCFFGSSRLHDFNDMRHSIRRPFRILCSILVNPSAQVFYVFVVYFCCSTIGWVWSIQTSASSQTTWVRHFTTALQNATTSATTLTWCNIEYYTPSDCKLTHTLKQISGK